MPHALHTGRRLAMALALGLSLAGPALAHSELRLSSPAQGARLATPPAELVLGFNEGVQVTAVRLHRAEGGEIALARPGPIVTTARHVQPLPPLAPGAYRVEWRIISAEGHPVGGTLRFQVEAAR